MQRGGPDMVTILLEMQEVGVFVDNDPLGVQKDWIGTKVVDLQE